MINPEDSFQEFAGVMRRYTLSFVQMNHLKVGDRVLTKPNDNFKLQFRQVVAVGDNHVAFSGGEIEPVDGTATVIHVECSGPVKR